MNSQGSQRVAVGLVTITIILVLTGAAFTSARLSPAPPLNRAQFTNLHSTVALLDGIVCALLALLLTLGGQTVKKLAWAALGIFTLEAILGMAAGGTAGGGSSGLRIAHACLAAVFLAFAVSLVVSTGRTWQGEPECIRDYGWPSTRSLAVAVPVLILLQIMLGAAFRHGAMGVMSHIVGAMLVALIIMIAGAFAMHQFPTHSALRPAALMLMVVTGVQVFLGMTAFIMRMMMPDTSPWLLGATVAHVVMGSLTLAASIAFSMQVQRCVLPKE